MFHWHGSSFSHHPTPSTLQAGYIRCYMDLVEQGQDYDSYCMLGEAFMQIQVRGRRMQAHPLNSAL